MSAGISLNIAVVTISDTRTEDTDKSGAVLVERLQESGHHLQVKSIVRVDI